MKRSAVSNNILVYNNNTGIVESMEPLFVGEGFRIVVAEDYFTLLKILEEQNIHMLLMDVALCEKKFVSGIEVIAAVRKRSSLPIIVLSADDRENTKIQSLNAGADDYVTANCNPLELLARVKSHLRRYTQLVNTSTNIDRIYRVDGLVLDDTRRKVSVDGREIKLTPIEYKILRLLVQDRGEVYSIRRIYEEIWHMQAIGADNIIAVHIRHIREKIERDPKQPQYLKVVWGSGYKVG